LRSLVILYGTELVTEIRGRHLKVIQSEMEAKGLALTTINHYCSRITRCFRWGVGEDLVPPDVAAILESVPNLQPGRSSAAQTDPVRSVPEERVEATLPYLHRVPGRRTVLAAMIRVQLLTGCRPGELCAMTGAAIDCRVNPWCYAAIDKNLHRHSRRQPRPVWIGPKAQKILRPFLDLAGDGRVWRFPPRGKGTVRAAINRVAYAEFIRLACIRAGVEPWTPHQLRHTRATQVAQLYESDAAAAAVIGDTEQVARTIYVDPNEAVARRIAKATG
jgi:integrase